MRCHAPCPGHPIERKSNEAKSDKFIDLNITLGKDNYTYGDMPLCSQSSEMGSAIQLSVSTNVPPYTGQ